jgi:hypothetical protein
MQNIDYVPTFLDAAGGDYTPKEMIFSERNWHGPSNDPMRSVRTARYHLIKNFDTSLKSAWTPENVPAIDETFESYPSSLFPSGTEPRDEIELFDREKDPYDWHNVADDRQLTGVKEELLTALDRWMRDTQDPLLEGEIPDMLHPWPAAPAS